MGVKHYEAGKPQSHKKCQTQHLTITPHIYPKEVMAYVNRPTLTNTFLLLRSENFPAIGITMALEMEKTAKIIPIHKD